MPTRTSAGVGDHSFFLILIPIDCKITNLFCLYLCLSQLIMPQTQRSFPSYQEFKDEPR